MLRPVIASAACAVLALVAGAAHAQAPLEDVSVDDLVGRLGGHASAKAWRPTAAPDITTNACQGSAAGKNLEVVPYAAEGAPHVNLAITFGTNSDELTGIDAQRLRTVARALNHPNLQAARFAVAGHTDATGDFQRNLQLSCARAIAARRFLVQQGVAPERLSAYGFGSNRRVEPTSGPSAANRRVEIRRAN